MTQHHWQAEPWWLAIQNALKPKLLLTMSLSILGAVVIFGLLFIPSEHHTFSGILMSFIGVLGSLFWFLFGLTGVAHQLHQDLQSEPIPNSVEAFRFAWSKTRALMLLPAWGTALLLVLLLGEMLLLSLANIPALGLIWLSLLAVPLLLLNSIVAVALLLALFNIAARVVLAGEDVQHLKEDLWHLMKQRLPTLLLYNLGGVLVSCVIAVVVLSPLWLGAQVTLSLVDYTANEAFLRIVDAIGFWGSIAHLLALIMLGLLLAAIASVPCIVITHMTLLVHQELMIDTESDATVSESDKENVDSK
ncbi:MAG: hypothetical protein Q9M21_04045 [Mariprofundaceae bacterium]|nr:hypothetical protein [Mariprofundaceae bacterium]